MSGIINENGAIFRYFEEISEIPRVSGNTKPIANYLVRFAEEHSLKHMRDSADNVIIYKPAAKGHENRPTVILQGHTDMVGAGEHDFDSKGIELICDGDILHANKTTLGADDGIAVAYMLALLAEDENAHLPALECVFTSNEEIGLLGAEALDGSALSGRLLINLDAGAEGCFIAGCAGGARLDITLSLESKPCLEEAFLISLSGFFGGHSGCDINRGRFNAIRELASLLSPLPELRIFELSGGTADNVIPSNASAIITSKESVNSLKDYLLKAEARLRDIEPKACIEFSRTKCLSAFTTEASKSIIELTLKLPFGVYAMSRELEGAVETSSNIGTIKAEKGDFHLTASVRSSENSEKQALCLHIEKIAEEYGAAVKKHDEYPGWRYETESEIRNVACRVYKEMYGKDAHVETVHAGLECGLFTDKLEGVDCISLGPDMWDIHTVDEKLSLSSFKRTYEFIKSVLKEI